MEKGEEMRLIDAEDIPYTMLYKENWMKGTGEEAQGAWKSAIDKMPTINAIPVVRCKQCQNWEQLLLDADGDCYCPFVDRYTTGEWYCADGERKSDAADRCGTT